MKKKVELKGKQIARFMNWLVEKVIFYGDPWIEWWKERGAEDFGEWSAKHGLNYVCETCHGDRNSCHCKE